MSSGRWQQLDRIFAEARQLPGAARGKFITDACGADLELCAEALSLLKADEVSGEFMAKPAFERLAQTFVAADWTLQPGEHVGAYVILEMLGSGGAGEVWRARDERLQRDVAIKVLLPHLTTDSERLRRFAEEVRTAGSLNHSNILTVYDVGEHRGTPFFVAECLEGRNLRQRLGSGALPVVEAARISVQVARGLAAAHARGIVHRDLKPENVFLRTDGNVKLLDFGMAKLQQPFDGLEARADNTVAGAIIGTAAYMAPEQIRGEQADARTDLFALGLMLFEMLTGRHPFRGAGTIETLHAILTGDPPDLLASNEHVPRSLAPIVTRLLQKPKEERFQSAVDLGWALEQFADGTGSPIPGNTRATPNRRSRRRLSGWLAATFLAAALSGAVAWFLLDAGRDPLPPRTIHFTWTLPDGLFLDSAPAVSPDGRYIAFAGRDPAGSRLYVRDLGALDARPVPGSDGARSPFWSPDSKSLAYFAGPRLMKVAWPGGAPVAIADILEPRGGAWSPSGTVLFAPDVILAALSRVHADGGNAEPATLLDVSEGDNAHWWPAFLPDGVHFLYYLRSVNDARRGIHVGRIDRGATHADTPLIRSDSGVIFAPIPGSDDGYIIQVADGRIELRRFDTARLIVAADARTIDFPAGSGTLYHPMILSASADVLAFAEAAIPTGNLVEAVARDGETLRLWDEAEAQNWPRISPDGERLARQRVDAVRGNPDIWVDDLARGTRVRVTTALEPDIQPVWGPDGRYLAYVSGALPGRPGATRILSIAAADGTGIVRTFPCPGEFCEPTDWSHDGRQLLLNVVDAGGMDVWTIATDETAAARPLLGDAFNERDARLSPDGRWVAYVTDESGQPAVSVRPVAGPPRRIVVSPDGGAQPVWRRDGNELYFVDPQGNLLSASVAWGDGGVLDFGIPTRVDIPPIGFGHWGTQYDVSPDGSRIYIMRRNDAAPPREIHIVTGWRTLLD